jgi:hypothetical protein
MPKQKSYTFKALIYKTGINFAVDVPVDITSGLAAAKGYVRIRGMVNNIPFTKSLVPVKGGPYRLFINTVTIKDIRKMVGQVAEFVIEQDTTNPENEFPMPQLLAEQLKQKHLLDDFNALPFYRRKEFLRYLANIKTAETLEKNIGKVISQLQMK